MQGDYVGFYTGNGEKLSCSQAEPGQASCLAVCSLVSLHFKCLILRSHPVHFIRAGIIVTLVCMYVPNLSGNPVHACIEFRP